jgi:hypothetical protein
MSERDVPQPEPAAEEEAVDTEAIAAEEEHDAPEMPMPPANFQFFVLSMKTQAELALGLLNLGEGPDLPKPDLRVARHTIDLLAMFSEKTKGNLTIEEQRLLENSLTELRFRYVQVMEAKSKQQ